MLRLIYRSLLGVYNLFFSTRKKIDSIILVVNTKNPNINDIQVHLSRFYDDLSFFFPDAERYLKIARYENLNAWLFIYNFFTGKIVFLVGYNYSPLQRVLFNHFNVDPYVCHIAAWGWHRALNYYSYSSIKNELKNKVLLNRFSEIKNALKSHNKAYLFGTGPSLIGATDFDFSDGIRIVCNTIVKSDRLWEHIKPNIVVAGDAIHHYSNTEYAKNFRKDLLNRLAMDDKLVFIYPCDFHAYIRKEFSQANSCQLLPILNSSSVNPLKHVNTFFSKPATENVLTMLQLPISISLSRVVYFIGYDGKRKGDSGFWKSSDEYNYIDDMNELKFQYPAFFNYYLNKKEHDLSYVRKVHGEVLERALLKHEKRGFIFKSLTTSNTETFQKRYFRK